VPALLAPNALGEVTVPSSSSTRTCAKKARVGKRLEDRAVQISAHVDLTRGSVAEKA
jgi:hypothetical protein